MADIHVLTGTGTRWSIIIHMLIPDVVNAVGVGYRAALVNSGLGGTTRLTIGAGPGEISAVEQDQITQGALYEHETTFLVESGGTSESDLRQCLREVCSQERIIALAHLQRALRYYGHTESEE